MLILPTGRKVPFSRSICKIFAALNICWGMQRLIPGLLFSFWRHLRSQQHKLCIIRTRRSFLLPVHADFLLHCLFTSSSLTCTAFVSSSPCRHMNHCFTAGAAKQLAPLLRQRVQHCLQSRLRQLSASVLFEWSFQDPRSPFNLSMQNKHLKKWNPRASPEEPAVAPTVTSSKSKAALRVIRMSECRD